MYKTALVVAALGLAACSPGIPDSNPETPKRGVGFGDYSDYNSYRRTPDAQPSGEVTVQAPPAAAPAAPSTDTAAAETPAALPPNDPGISDSQNFAAVSERETIESDAARLAALRNAYEEAQPVAVPTRTGSEGPNIVEYALSTSHPRGTKVYNRNNLFAGNKYETNCAKYYSPDLAQEAFLQAGGPERDKLGIDPDGDGYACSWDPAPFRRISG